ncbi:unnamed protein product [Leptosia nina]|uniref:Major facilitator superfamily (MFS) profile domain-containing protein n=1 Tax=Leptosia nina TaxID=320188 RepID=A0AAV1JLJ9_9NEOP
MSKFAPVSASSANITCFCGFAIVAILTEILGRRKSLIILNIPVLASWIVVFFAKDMVTLLLSRIVLGVSYGGVLMLTYICVGEYSSPNIRSLCLNLIASVGSLIGTGLGHMLSLLVHWRTVALIGVVPSSLAVAVPYFWVESPAWLASKGRFEECTRAFHALHVTNDVTKEELSLLIATERNNQRKIRKHRFELMLIISKISFAIKHKYFWRISILNTVVNIYRVAGGRVLFSTLAITILKDITGDADILKETLFVDIFFILGALMSCALVKRFKTRKLLFTSGIAANILLVILTLVIYLHPGKDDKFNWIKVTLFAVYFITMMAGPYAVLETLLIEIIPLSIKSFFIFFFGAVIGVFQFMAVKFVPNMVNTMGYHGIFSVNATIVFLCLAYLWFKLPETKGKSLEEIENYFKDDRLTSMSSKLGTDECGYGMLSTTATKQ